MKTREYIKQYSHLYENDSDLANYELIDAPTESEMPSQIELHMDWDIELPATLVERLEYYIEQGVAFKRHPRVYYQIDEKYWPLVKHLTRFNITRVKVTNADYTYSIALHKKAPKHFSITEYNYSSLECLETIPLPKDMWRAACIGSVQCLRYLHEHKVPPGEAPHVAAFNGHIDALEYLFSIKADMCNAIRGATINNQYECLKFLHKRNVPFDDAITHAAIYGHIKCLKYIHVHGSPWHNAIHAAAENGQIECLIYLYNNGAPINDAMIYAAQGGHINCIYYLLTKGVSIQFAMIHAAASGRLQAMKYLKSKGGSWRAAMDFAAGAGHVKCMEYMRKKGVGWENSMLLAGSTGNLKVLKYLHSHNVPWGVAIDAAITNRHSHCVNYMLDNGASMPKTVSLEIAASARRLASGLTSSYDMIDDLY